MKRLWIAVALLAALLICSFVNYFYIKAFCKELTGDLSHAEEYAQAGNWDLTEKNIGSALSKWESHEHYLHIVFIHQDIDQILISFHSLQQLAQHRETLGMFSSSCAGLITQIDLLYEMDELTLENIF
jgi:hypothetical protein